mmetsp:Transcript_24056/g.72183  ORF Transcript_24056/g.72183 Transcript_24056/m.72183 type:complete len:212 (+) Transcript_24056:54-689(+)|eukprot:CAMPEP_0119273284 /NCGR_PEP_ID=MMETSP1329-20130426/9956_1 /TAXON_ID=114041 /ORGANISM="Genus nov. species nov., Strain RCC1024" /LENGTH=211 /DNA_ID=CAMNT_0007273473 /DNA_START=40 /DNA_END=675 /DNA_ORIENTATION=+
MARCIALALLAAGSRALVPARPAPVRAAPLRAESTALVPVNEETIKTSSAVTAGVGGLVLGGPVLAIVTAVLGNYVSKQEGEVGEVVRGVGKVSLDVYNFLLKLDGKYDVTGKGGEALKEQLEKLKAGESGATVSKVESTLSAATAKFDELNKEYDLLEKSKQAIGYAGDLSVKAIDKGLELNKEYKITEQVTAKAAEAVEKAKASAKVEA